MLDSQAPWSAEPERRSGVIPRGLMLRLLDSLRGRTQPLQPAGQRSGRGARSVQPYLEDGRKSRPAPLE